MKNCNKIKKTCGTTMFATCVSYEGTVNSISEYTDNDCLSIEETTQDIYNQLEQLNLSELGNACLEYVEEDGKLLVKNVLKKYEDEICTLKEELETVKNTQFCNMKVTECGLDFSCLELPCEQEILTVKDLFQALINKVCTTP